jgi:hypothetical protein
MNIFKISNFYYYTIKNINYQSYTSAYVKQLTVSIKLGRIEYLFKLADLTPKRSVGSKRKELAYFTTLYIMAKQFFLTKWLSILIVDYSTFVVKKCHKF